MLTPTPIPIFDLLVRIGSGAGDSAAGYAVGVIGMDCTGIEVWNDRDADMLPLTLIEVLEAIGALPIDGSKMLDINVVEVRPRGAAPDCCGGLASARGRVGATDVGAVAAGCMIGCVLGGGGATVGFVVSVLSIGDELMVC